MDPTQGQATLAELGAPRPLPAPQTAALSPQDEGIDSLAQPTMGQTIARNTIMAGQQNHGDARDWAENAVAGVNAALAGFGAAGKVPEGAGALYGVGAAMRQQQANRQEQAKIKTEQQQRQEQIDLEKQRTQNEQTNFDKDYQLKLAENARQQAQSVREMSDHDARLRQMDDSHKLSNFELMHQDLTFRQAQLEREDALKTVGAKPVTIAGKEAPAFDDLGQLEAFASANNLGDQAHLNGYRTRPVLGADGKYKLYEVPDTEPEWHTLKGADGKPTKIFTDPLGALNYQEKVATINQSVSRTALDYAEAARDRDLAGQAETSKKARAELDKAGGDYSKLSPGAREALTLDAQRYYQLAFNAYQAAENDMRKDPDFANIPIDAKTGNMDTTSKEYKELGTRYHVEDANEILGSAYDQLRKLGHGYKPYGQEPAKPGTVGNPTLKPFEAVGSLPPKPTKPGEKLDAEGARKYAKLTGGDMAKAAELAVKDGWDINQ